jgi:16S rRNA (guanine527-N7)-methyltransferase
MPGGRQPLPPESFRSLLAESLSRVGAEESSATVDRLASFLAELDRWRGRINLTGRLWATELADHAAESLLGERFLPPRGRAADIGTGGGFPGVPLAIARPDLDWTWVEPREKRVAFLRHVQRALPVANAVPLCGRLQDLSPGVFDAATSRAVGIGSAGLGDAHFLKPGGILVLWTTEAARRADILRPALQLEAVIGIPGSRRREIAAFRKA